MKTFTAREYLKIDIANSFGLDKKNWDVRLQWFHDHEDKLPSMLEQAKTPALYYAGVKAWEAVLRGEPSGYPISLDGTASGMQILSALTCDRKAASLCNVLDTGKRENAYTNIYNAMVEQLGESATISDDDVKQAVMTSLYGSEAEPVKIFGTGALLNTFYSTMEQEAPIVWELNRLFLQLWNPEASSNDWVLPDNFHVHVKVMRKVEEQVHFLNTPYTVVKEINAPKKIGRSIGANTTHSLDALVVREMGRRCMYDPQTVSDTKSILVHHGKDKAETLTGILLQTASKQTHMVLTLWDHYKKSGYLSARIIDYINVVNVRYVDKAVLLELIESLPAKPFQVVSVHDCWRCLPSYGNDLRKQYNLQLSLIAKSNLLSYIISQIVGSPVTAPAKDESMAEEILQADYALS